MAAGTACVCVCVCVVAAVSVIMSVHSQRLHACWHLFLKFVLPHWLPNRLEPGLPSFFLQNSGFLSVHRGLGGSGVALQPAVRGLSRQYLATETSSAQARHCAVIALQHIGVGVGVGVDFNFGVGLVSHGCGMPEMHAQVSSTHMHIMSV